MDVPIDLHERIPCPCTQCKYQIIRKRYICDAHIRKVGVFPREHIQNLRFQSYVETNEHPPCVTDIAPTMSRPRQRQRVIEDTPRDIQTEGIEEDAIEEMLDAFYEVETEFSINQDSRTENDQGCNQANQTQRLDQEETIMRRLARLPLYEGAKISVLRTSLALLNLQSTFGWSDTSVSALFKLLKEQILPDKNDMPPSRTDAKNLLSSIGMDYQKIHACRNDCILFWREYEHALECPKCGSKRYREDVQGEAIPTKVLRHFPIIPRIKSMFRCKSIAGLMTWHRSNRSTDEVLRVPADSPAWKHIEDTWPSFKDEPRSLRFGLAMDGVNPFGLRSSSWSTWPVCLVNYNLPPWLAIKKGHLLLSLIIPGKYKVKNVDVYLAPLVEELQILWAGIEVKDMSKPAWQRNAVVQGILMWTMHDWPGYGECSGLSTSGYNACPLCGPRLDARYSTALRKTVYEGHVRYLPEGHALREGNLGRPLNRSLKLCDWKKKWEDGGNTPCPGIKRLSILHSLPYWGCLLINHLLDPMHIFKNVGETLWKTLIGERENKGQRDDLQDLGRMQGLWVQRNPNGKLVLPKAPWVLNKVETEQVKRTISEFRTPTGCMHCLKGAFTKDDKLTGLKSHDWHKFLQFVLPVAIKDCLNSDIRETIYKISSLVRWISSKEIRKDTLEASRLNAIEAICMVEKYFPTSVLTIQMHLLVHVVDEVAVAGTVNSRWMFFLERFMKTLKSFVRQKAHPEGSMAEGWLVQESMVLITESLSAIDPEMPRLWSAETDVRVTGEEAQGKGMMRKMDARMRDKVMKFCILNSHAMERWVESYEEAKRERQRDRANFRRNRATRNQPYPDHLQLLPEFPSPRWLDTTISKAKSDGIIISEEEDELALGCDWHYYKFGALWSHGRHFRVERIDSKRSTFDCGVRANFVQESRASARDDNAEIGMLDYFGTIQDIIKVVFRSFEMFIFDVKWFKVILEGSHASVRRDKSGLLQVDSTKVWTDSRDTFVRPEHCEQVIFKQDPKEPRWLYVVQVAPRSKPICEGLEIEHGDGAEEAAQPTQEVDEEELPREDDDVEQEVDEEELPREDDDVEQEVNDEIEEEQAREDFPLNFDEDAEIGLEIDLFGTSDLAADGRLDLAANIIQHL